MLSLKEVIAVNVSITWYKWKTKQKILTIKRDKYRSVKGTEN